MAAGKYMAMLEYNEITLRKYVIFEGDPYEVLDSHVFRKQQRKPVNAVKMKNLLTGRVVEHSFHVSDKAEEAEIVKKDIKFLYANSQKGEFWFCDPTDPSKRFSLTADFVGDAGKWMKTNSLVKARLFEEKIFGIELPAKVELKVTEAQDAVKGDTAKSSGKYVKLETGADIMVPMFVNQGDTVRINTESGDYVERVQ